ncbi:conserved hypothetical protein [Candidatus Methylobacter favarea]|uniref:Uncharacterized protein n=1 Tax=Candidatus Methylobacter favarea TaxID=2707345 RepID=A0A8S0WPY0_9GAMM|nr:conserved hypothetical protein [Candidatus Methylobacter favarea]
MKTLIQVLCTLLLVLFITGSYGEDSPGKVCLNIPEPGAELVKIESNCKKGDIIMLNKIHIAHLCDFNSAVAPYNGHDKYICVYLGEKRELRKGTN